MSAPTRSHAEDVLGCVSAAAALLRCQMREVRIVDGEVVTAHGETPESMLARDRARYPGGHMAGYIVWHSEHLRAFTAAHPATAHPSYYLGHHLTSDGHWAFDAWLRATAAPVLAATGGMPT